MRTAAGARRAALGVVLTAVVAGCGGCGGGEQSTSTAATPATTPEAGPQTGAGPASGGTVAGSPEADPAGSPATPPAAPAETGGHGQASSPEALSQVLRSPQGRRYRACIRAHGTTPPPIPTPEHPQYGGGDQGDGFASAGAAGPETETTEKRRLQYQRAFADPEALAAARKACAGEAPDQLRAGG